MTEPQDHELSRIYKDAGMPEPPQQMDEAILAASRRAAASRPRLAPSQWVWRSRIPVALAATVLLSFTVTLMVLHDARELDSEPLAKKPETTEERGKSAPSPAPKARAAPQTDNRGNRGAESLALAEGPDASRPGFVRDAPSEPARSAPDSLATRQRAQDSPDPGKARAARESMAAAQPAPAAPSAPAAAASPRRETALQRSDAASGQAGGVAGSEAKERRPKQWIEDIRRLKAQGKTQEADRELAEFKRRYPEHRRSGGFDCRSTDRVVEGGP
jgi:hypothetical protein